MNKPYIQTGRDYVREKVRMRDNFICQECGADWLEMPEGTRRFDVHHLNGACGQRSRGYDRVSELDGLTTLCHRCHLALCVDKEKFMRRPLKDVTDHKLEDMRGQGMSYDAIGKELGAASATVYYRMNGRVTRSQKKYGKS